MMAKFLLSGFADEIDTKLDVQVKELKRLGIDRIEIRGVNGKSIIDYTEEETKEFKKLFDDEGITVSALGSPIGKIGIKDPFSEHLDKFKHTINLAGILETDYIRMFSFYMPENENPDKYRDEVLERWYGFVEAAKGTGLVLAHENEKGIYGDTAQRCLDIIESMNVSYVRAVFDPANFIQCHEETYPKAYNMLAPYISYMHIKDAILDTGEVVPAGYGDGKILEIIKELDSRVDSEMVLSLEPHLGSFEGLAGLEKALNLSNMEQSGPGKFELAVTALRAILKEVN
jgi:sugar phosphate isomerase/epimerase